MSKNQKPTPEARDQSTPALGRFDLYTQHSEVTYFDSKPIEYDLFEPNVVTDEVPILINNGYCAPAMVYDAMAIGLAQNGRRAIRYHPPRNVSLSRRVLGGHIQNPLKKHAQAGWAVMKHAQTKYGFGRFDVLGHSMGTPVSLMLAVEKHQHVRSVMCTGGAGLDGAGGLLSMATKAVSLLRNEVLVELDKISTMGGRTEIARAVANHILSHPADTLAEGFYVSRANAKKDLEKAHSAGIRLGAMLFENDSFFDSRAVLQHVGDLFDFTAVIEGAKHIHPQLYPLEHAEQQVVAFATLNREAPSLHVA